MNKNRSEWSFDANKEFGYEKYVGEDGFELPYRIYIPRDYDCGATYPLLVMLHGAGERGCDNEEQIRVNFTHMFDDPQSPVFNSIIIAPQCAEDKQWVYTPWEHGNYSIAEVPESRECEAVLEIIKNIDREYNIDRSRIYITGLSMGGFGTWDMLMRHPSLFAAGMPVCGAADPSMAKVLSDIPIRTCHGSLDTCVPTDATREMYSAIKAFGKGKIKYIEYENVGHDSWENAYSDPENVKWLFSQTNEKRLKKNAKAKRAGLAGVALGVVGAVIFSIVKKKK